MVNKTFNARWQNKRDTSGNWEQSKLIILDGELIIVDIEDGCVRTKIGDGVSIYSELPFSDQGNTQSVSVSFTVPADGWVDGTQTIVIDALKDGRSGFVSMAENCTTEQYEAVLLGFLQVASGDDGTLLIYASGDTPTVDVPMTIVVF